MPKQSLKLEGKKFGKLTVIEKTNLRYHGRVIWKCKCECGNDAFVNSYDLISDRVKSCGCMRRYNLVGRKFGRLTVIKEANRNSKDRRQWLCKCDCGNEVILPTTALTTRNTRSCGCLRTKDLVGRRFGKITVLEKTNKKKYKRFLWKCKCDCGNIIYLNTTELLFTKLDRCSECRNKK